MQARHTNPEQYFDEMVFSCRNYYIPYIAENSGMELRKVMDVLEIGCGLGGTLSVFAERGCNVTGVDIQPRAIELAQTFFADRGLDGTFVCANVFDYASPKKYDLVILHDAIEHISEKERLMALLKGFLKPGGVLYIAFPAWQMPFGGHQQMARNRALALIPYTHLLPRPLFRALFRACGENEGAVRDYFSIRDTRITIEGFERLARNTGYGIANRQLWLINPNYRVKFGLKPRKLARPIAATPWVRNFFTTTCYYLLR